MELKRARAEAVVLDVPVGVVMAEVRMRLRDWRAILAEESTQARQMLKNALARPAGVHAGPGAERV